MVVKCVKKVVLIPRVSGYLICVSLYTNENSNRMFSTFGFKLQIGSCYYLSNNALNPFSFWESQKERFFLQLQGLTPTPRCSPTHLHEDLDPATKVLGNDV